MNRTVEGIEELPALRAGARTFLTSEGIGSDPVLDTELVISELVSNAFEHGRARGVHVIVRIEDGQISLSVEHIGVPALPIPGPESISMPDSSSMRQRGLAIIDEIVTERRTVEGSRGTLVECRLPRH